KGRWKSGLVTTFDVTYFDIVPGERIVYAYEMHMDERKISISLASIEFKASGAGTRLIVTEQGAFLDGYDDNGSRERGTQGIIDKLGAYLTG
ncbi:MAG TPA: SRPBCC domain-containing protein, partial [Burkholderiaceae bacterium]